MDPECAEAYLGKLMAQLRVRKPDALRNQNQPFHNNINYQRALLHGSDEMKKC